MSFLPIARNLGVQAMPKTENSPMISMQHFLSLVLALFYTGFCLSVNLSLQGK